ncbi:hypothetical protein MKO06_01140 [Gramella sp. GC03-9]|uniref:Uncharacterized protein n=1 Tax=Christiangramia oceanisediminis TaxID=2920386 RepID=A0A9X2KVI9_9FLAO|nr:hypothetical protein [Gramella oceanisediminis]MCP9198493.1 hypothetical protein [Gramella oceanisediminis]
MSFKSTISQKGFWKSVFWLGISFLVLYNVISMLFEYGEFAFARFFEERTADGKLIRFIIAQVLAAFAYGFILSLGQFRAKEKKN